MNNNITDKITWDFEVFQRRTESIFDKLSGKDRAELEEELDALKRQILQELR